MKQIKGIYTIRDVAQHHYWDIIFEWENIFSSILKAPLFPIGKKYDRIYRPSIIRKVLNRVNAYQLFDRFLLDGQNLNIAFHIGPPGTYSFHSRSNVLPIIVDFWKNENLRRLESIFRFSPAVVVTSREVFEYLQESDLQVKIMHLPLSLPDKYFGINHKRETHKDIDIIQLGRRNTTFDEYIDRFLVEFPATHYVHAVRKGSRSIMMSNKLGELGQVPKREQFIGLLLRSKISLVSAPGLDEDRERTGGFSPVTPRFLESAACACRLIGIYPGNADFDYYGIKEVCPAVTSFGQFRNVAVEYLSEQKRPDFSTFLEKHLTSKRAIELLNKLTSLND